ncbi:Thioesterase-like superfamily protein [compost metagenome]
MNDLNHDSRTQYGVEPGWAFGKHFEVRWSDIDPFGHANNLAYLGWCEETRNAYLESLGVPRFTREAPGPVIKELGFTYDRSLEHGEKILLTGRVAWIRRTSFRMEFAAWNGSRVGHGHAICVWMINATGEKVAVADELRRLIVDRDGAELLSSPAQ